MSPKPFFSGRIPQELYNRVEEHIANTGESKTDVLINSLAAYLGFSIPSSSLPSSLLEMRITELEQKFVAIDELSRVVADLKQAIASIPITNDNKFDNEPDNTLTSGQLSILEKSDEIDKTFESGKTDNSIDKEFDNDETDNDKIQQEQESEKAGYKQEDTIGDWEFLGEMHIPEITALPGLESWDRTKLKQKLRNIKKHKKEKKAVIASYLFELVGKEPGTKGQMIFEAYRSTLSNNKI